MLINSPIIAPIMRAVENAMGAPRSSNYLLWSEAYDNAAWTKAGGVTVAADQTAAPNGAVTADKLTKTAAGFLTANQPYAATLGQTLTYSFYVQSGTLTKSAIRMICSTTDWAFDINIGAGTIALRNSSGTGGGGALVSVGNGWFRASMWLTMPSTATLTCYSYAGNVSDAVAGTIFVWGAQLNPGTAPQQYIKTTSTARP